MKKVFLFIVSCFFLFGCSSDNGPGETPIDPVPPVADFSASETDVETGSTVNFTDDSQYANSYEWTFEGGDPASSTAKNPAVTYANAGSFSVSLKVTNDDGEDTETKAGFISVSDSDTPPVAEFSAASTSIETGSSIEFTDSSTGSPTEWAWDFEGGDPATSDEQNPTVTYATAGTYSVTLTATNSNGDDEEVKTDYITVEDPAMIPVANFTASATTIIRGNDITFTDTSTNEPIEWAWEFEGGDPAISTEQNPTVNYATAGTFSVTLTVTNADGTDEEVKTEYITVENIVPVADFSASQTTITSGSSITFTDASANEPTSWSWEFEGGSPSTSSEQNPTVTYNNFGTYEVTLTATNSAGSDVETKNGYITVNMQTASYTVTFKGNWSAANHPTNFPGGDHFSSAVGMVHKPGATFFQEGQLASLGIKDMAEKGQNGPLSSEIGSLVSAGSALQYYSGGGLSDGLEEVSFTINVTEEFSFVTLVSMIAPSPDWFVAAEAVNLFENGNFINDVTIGGVSYDAGTDSGVNFTSSDSPTTPFENISKITSSPLGNGTTVDPPVAYFIFVKN